GTIYVATQGSGVHISTDGGTSFINKTTANGLVTNVVYGIYMGNDGTIYAATSSGLSIARQATGNSLAVTSAVAGDVYKVRLVPSADVCPSPAMAMASVTILATPTVPITSNLTICSGSTASLSASCASGTVNWYDSNSSTLLATTASFTTPNLTTATTYQVRCESGSCTSGFVAVNVNINPVATATEIMIWRGTISSDWNNPCNWSPNGVPSATNPVTIPNVANDPVIMSGTTAYAFNIAIGNNASLTINSGGELNVLPTDESQGFFGIPISSNGTFINNGILNATTTANIRMIGLFDNSTFNNNGTTNFNSPLINIQLNGPNAMVNNGASGTINLQSGRGFQCINGTTGNVITNEGIMNYTGYDYLAALNPGFSLNNSGTIDIRTGSGIAIQGGTLSNLACARILMPARRYENQVNGSITTNAGLMITGEIRNTNGSFTNNGVLKHGGVSGNAIINNQNSSVIVNNTQPIFTYGGTFDGTINGIFKDAATTTSAGIFTAPNTFVPDISLPVGTQTLYTKITPGGGACNYIVPFTYLNCSPVTAPTGTSNPTICSGASTSLSATCASGTVKWYDSNSTTLLATTTNYITPNLTTTTTYNVRCELGSCKSSFVGVNVTVEAAIVATASNSGPYLIGNTIELNATGGNSYSWTGPNSFTSSLQNPTISNALLVNSGIYSVTVTSGICTATATTNVVVNGINPCDLVVEYQFVKAGNPYQPLFNLTNDMNINQLTDEVSILVVPVCPTVQIESFNMNIQGTNLNYTITQNVSPYSVFDNIGTSVFGRVLPAGTYTLTVTGYSQDNLQGNILYSKVLTFTILPNSASINMPTLSRSSICGGSNLDITLSLSNTYNPSNQFNVELSDANGEFESDIILGNTSNIGTYIQPIIIGTSNSAGTINCSIPSSVAGGTNYRIRVISTDGVSVSPISTALTIHPKDLNLASPTNDINTNIGTKQASQTITATNKVNSTANVIYQAGKSITLNTGFEAKAGTVFQAQIGGCGNN
ncbi:MAG: 3-coathanger stack domain-containing protein, partial [Emticicia sp.]|uniref:Ig-like domain-containing protein n=1 Tax=Emticicia sp. TaxID=1930953 RepID=UPI003BA6536F